MDGQAQQHAYALEYARRANREIKEVARATSKIKHPSRLKFLIYFVMAAVLDILDVLQLTGFGIILIYFLKFLFAPILFLHGIRASRRIKNSDRVVTALQEKISHIQKKIYAYTRRYLMAVRLGRKVKSLRKPIRLAALKIAKARRLVLRNPAVKNTVAILADFVPLFDLFPWRTLGVYLTYRDERKTFEEATPVVQEYQEAKRQEIEIDMAEIETAAEAEEEMAEIEETEDETGQAQTENKSHLQQIGYG